MIGAVKEFADRLLGRGDATITVPLVRRRAETQPGPGEGRDDRADRCAGRPRQRRQGAVHRRRRRHPPPRRHGCNGIATLRSHDHGAVLCCRTAGWPSRSTDARCRYSRRHRRRRLSVRFSDSSLTAVNALSAGPAGTLIATDGSSARPYGQWVHDLMERGRTGRVLVLDIASGRVNTIASKAQYAFGACAAGDNVLFQRELAASPGGDPAGRAPASRARQSAGLSFAHCRPRPPAAFGSPPSRHVPNSSNSFCARAPIGGA